MDLDYIMLKLLEHKRQIFNNNKENRLQPENDLDYIIEIIEDHKSKVIVYDLETSGLDPIDNGIVQVCVIDYKSEEVLFNSYIKPDPIVTVSPRALQVNGTYLFQLFAAPTFNEQKEEIQRIFSKADLVIGYNTFNFIDNFLMANGISLRANAFDLMEELTPVIGKWPRLSECAEYFEIEIEGKLHNALTDCLVIVRIIKEYIKCYKAYKAFKSSELNNE